jgi:hypothetical protein
MLSLPRFVCRGQLGTGSFTVANTPQTVLGLAGVTKSLSVSKYQYACTVLTNDTVSVLNHAVQHGMRVSPTVWHRVTGVMRAWASSPSLSVACLAHYFRAGGVLGF